MTKAIATTATTALTPALASQLAASLDTALNQTAKDGGDYGPILKMTKSGEWMYGADEIDVEEGSLWAVNPLSFQIGYVCWVDGSGEPPEEAMAALHEPPIDATKLPRIEGSKRGWQRQMAVDMMCVSGEDEGVVVRYTTSSKGGLKALRTLIDAVRRAVADNSGNIVPVIKLDSSYYKHKEYGRIYNPVLDIQKFVPLDTYQPPEDEDAEPEPQAGAEPEPQAGAEPEPQAGAEPEPEPRRRRRRPAE